MEKKKSLVKPCDKPGLTCGVKRVSALLHVVFVRAVGRQLQLTRGGGGGGEEEVRRELRGDRAAEDGGRLAAAGKCESDFNL